MEDAIKEIDYSMNFHVREQKRVYLITYSQADLTIVGSCERFAEIICTAVEPAATIGRSVEKITEQYAVCSENHADGNLHYHMAIKLRRPKKWYSIKNAVYRVNGISLHFSVHHVGYIAAYRYVRKDKPKSSVLHSPNHPNLDIIGPLRTRNAMIANRSRAEARRSQDSVCEDEERSQPVEDSAADTPPRKVKKLNNTDVGEFLVANNLRTEVELMSEAQRRYENGERDLYDFILRKNPKALSDLILTTWQIQSAPVELERRQSSRMDIIVRTAGACLTEGCDGQWLVAAREVLQRNEINSYVFADALRTAFRCGREKFVNIFLYGNTNMGKSFLLTPLEHLFKAFVNPANGRYAWVGLDTCDVAFLNDFRYSAEMISWSDFLLLLEGATVHLPRPRNMFSTDLCIHHTNKIPFFATSSEPLVKSNRQADEKENDMMNSRWKFFAFTKKIPEDQMRKINPCVNCFSNLVLLGMNE